MSWDFQRLDNIESGQNKRPKVKKPGKTGQEQKTLIFLVFLDYYCLKLISEGDAGAWGVSVARDSTTIS